MACIYHLGFERVWFGKRVFPNTDLRLISRLCGDVDLHLGGYTLSTLAKSRSSVIILRFRVFSGREMVLATWISSRRHNSIKAELWGMIVPSSPFEAITFCSMSLI